MAHSGDDNSDLEIGDVGDECGREVCRDKSESESEGPTLEGDSSTPVRKRGGKKAQPGGPPKRVAEGEAAAGRPNGAKGGFKKCVERFKEKQLSCYKPIERCVHRSVSQNEGQHLQCLQSP
jgi:hypothetical protein